MLNINCSSEKKDKKTDKRKIEEKTSLSASTERTEHVSRPKKSD